ncbi:MAG: urea ABC transporter permease subunit UrtB [Rhodobacteraceae bacterium]|nr:urea ABC transporter permease subunit UrtB [Paracoccaceae bacterium]
MLKKLLITIVLIVQGLAVSAQDFEASVAQLPEGGYSDRAIIVHQIADSGDDRAAVVLELLLAGDLYFHKAERIVVRLSEIGDDDVAFDLLTDAEIGIVGRRDAKKIKVNNGLRREIRAVLGAMYLQNPDPDVRMEAAEAVYKSGDPDQISALDAAIVAETDDDVATAFREARAVAVLNSDLDVSEKLAAIVTLRERGGRDVPGVLAAFTDDPDLGAAATTAITEIEDIQKLWNLGQNIWYGLSLGSVLLLAAIGLAITFGVMGVINMAHGELVMLGAYTTFAVQEVIRNEFPQLFDYSLFIAAPLAFLVAGLVGVAIERGVVRFLYGRPLETLLATWGISLILQQTVRSIFGPNNREVGNPTFMSGAFELGGMTITYSRMWILLFSLVVFAGLLLLLKRTSMGLRMRAVTQNRKMAADMGINTGWVDAMTFGLGAGVAGLAGVALSQIGNVSPNLGQGYIVDSFMVVVFGGAGNLWGALAGAFSLGIANKFLEPFAGAVLAKIIVLIFIILFIQKRPRGLFALKGRAVEN